MAKSIGENVTKWNSTGLKVRSFERLRLELPILKSNLNFRL